MILVMKLHLLHRGSDCQPARVRHGYGFTVHKLVLLPWHIGLGLSALCSLCPLVRSQFTADFHHEVKQATVPCSSTKRSLYIREHAAQQPVVTGPNRTTPTSCERCTAITTRFLNSVITINYPATERGAYVTLQPGAMKRDEGRGTSRASSQLLDNASPRRVLTPPTSNHPSDPNPLSRRRYSFAFIPNGCTTVCVARATVISQQSPYDKNRLTVQMT